MKKFWLLLILVIPIIYSSCHRFRRPGLPFGDVKGTHFTEVRRAFSSGLVFDRQGYQLVPSWKMYFISDDSVMVFSPKMKRYYGFHVYFDHDSIFNMVDAWFKLKKLDADSVVLEALRVEDKVISDDEDTKVLLTFYSDRFIKKRDTARVRAMGLPGPKDTLFIKERSILANQRIDSAFSATSPVMLKSRTPLVKVEKVKSESTPLAKIDPSVDYLYPEYNIAVSKAYENFDYSFSVFVDEKGIMHFRKSNIPYSAEYKATYEQVMKGIMSGYLQHYLEVKPGNTLGITHNTAVLLNVTGRR
jgi:hypothetical protein